MALFGLKVLMGTYILVRLIESFRARRTLKPNQSLKMVGHRVESSADAKELKINHYLQLSTLAIILVPFSYLFPLLRLLNLGIISYISVPILKDSERSLLEEGRIKGDFFNSLLSVICITTNQYFLAALMAWFYHFFRKLVFKIKDFPRILLLANFVEWQPNKVWVLRNNVEIEIPLKTLKLDDILVVNQGEVISVDGIIIKGQALIEQFVLTGELESVEKSEGEPVFAATMVVKGHIHVKVEKTGDETAVYKMGKFFR
jgi:cation transport ATPase